MLLKIEFKPLEPYFFGNERSLQYKGVNQKVQMKAASYFAKSELIPLQSTLFGALRYLGIVEKRRDFKLTSEDEANIGKASFQLKKEGQSFGKIKRISSLYLTDKKGDVYIRVPADQPDFGEEERIYKGFGSFESQPVATQNGTRYLPKIDLKKGFFDGYVRVKDGVCFPTSEIFKSVVRTGIDVARDKDAYFKKEYYFMPNHAFMIYAEVENEFPKIKDLFVKLGQGKTAFSVSVTEVTDMTEAEFDASTAFPVEAEKVVLLSDSYVRDVKALYACCYFSHSDVRDYRAMETVYNAEKQSQRYRKQEVLLKLLKAGSVFWVRPECMEAFRELLNDKQAQIAGFNLYMTGGNR